MAKKKVKPIPKGYSSVQASLNLPDAKSAMEFVKKVFGGKIMGVMPGPDGKIMHGEVRVGESVIMFSDAVMDPPRPGNLMVYVPNVDKTFGKAVKAGAKALMPPSDQFWGDRFGRFEDPFGNRWGVGTHIEDVTPKQMKKRMAEMAKKKG
ncbi:MAG TPA: VOC family protein [Polyangiaceae bacterium]|nr:VOC family protein [Polyangiaceae bacterium]